MWDHSKSLLLTAWWMRIAFVLWLALAVVIPFLHISTAMQVIFYMVYIPIAVTFYGLGRMLYHIQQGIVFDRRNVACLRLVSWACFFAAVFLLIGACLWLVLILAAGVIGFLGLFVRVIKNMLTEAILIKEENDYTI